MKLEEAFEKYNDEIVMKRLSKPHFSADIKWLKMFHAWGNEESRRLGFFIPGGMISDATADDWEKVDERD